jgi:hypothetical protein
MKARVIIGSSKMKRPSHEPWMMVVVNGRAFSGLAERPGSRASAASDPVHTHARHRGKVGMPGGVSVE